MMQLGGNVNLIEQLHTNLSESVAVLVEAFGNKITMIVAYVPPRYDKKQFVNELDNELEILSKYKILVVLTADFNINVLAENHLQQSHVNTITANCFELLSRNATRKTGVAEKCFDHLIGKNIEKPYVRILENEYFSDHCPVLLQLKSKQFNLIFSSFRDMSFLNNEKGTNDFFKSDVAYNNLSDSLISTLNHLLRLENHKQQLTN